MNKQIPQKDIFFQIKNRASATVAMLAGMELDVFTPLKDGPLSAEQLALRLGVNARRLGTLLYTLVIFDLLIEEEGTFSNTPETDRFFVKGKDGYIGDSYKIWKRNLLASLKTAESIRTNVPQAKYDWKNLPKSELRALMEGMSSYEVTFAKWLSEEYNFTKHRKLLDAGCGSGKLAITMTQIHPNLTATVADFPEVTSITKQFVMDAKASNRVRIISADLTRDIIPGMYDVAILSSVIQTLSAEEARKVINNIGKVINPGGWLYILGSGILKNSRLSPQNAVELNLVFINTYDGGQSYTEDEHRKWLNEAGFYNITFQFEECTIIAQKQE